MITSWSFTRVIDYERCPLYAHLKYTARIVEPERELRPGQTEQANDRGSRIHKLADDFINGRERKLDHTLFGFMREFRQVRWGKENGKVSTEEEWGFDHDWNVAEWSKAWHRSKLDIMYKLNAYQAVVIDLKTGRKDGNEAKHGQQLQLYAVDTCLRDAAIEEVTSEAWYLDSGDLTSVVYPRKVVLAFKKSWQNRGNKITLATEFPPNPNRFSCKYCGYGPWGTNHCKVGVR